MASIFEKGFNKFADIGNQINKQANKLVGKEIFGEIRKIEEPRDFPPYDSFPKYDIPEPEQWSDKEGETKEFTLDGNYIYVSPNLDKCMKFREYFISSAHYYVEQFKFKYKNCVEDFDSLVHYFFDIYLEGLMGIGHRAYSLLLPFGVFSEDIEKFISRHMDNYHKAIDSYETIVGIEQTKNQSANNLGNLVGNSIQLQGGGFGFKGAAKGIAQAEAFNLGIGLLGKYVENQTKMTQEEKSKVYLEINTELLFEEVYDDYLNMFLTFIQTLADNSILGKTTTLVSNEYSASLKNLQNPMFPQNKFSELITQLITTNPFVPACFELIKQKYGETEEVNKIVDYFVI